MHEVATRSTYTASSSSPSKDTKKEGETCTTRSSSFSHPNRLPVIVSDNSRGEFRSDGKRKKKEKSTRVPINWPCPYPVSFARDLRGESSKNTQHVISRSGGFWIIRPISIIVYQYARLKVVNRFFSSKRKREGIAWKKVCTQICRCRGCRIEKNDLGF